MRIAKGLPVALALLLVVVVGGCGDGDFAENIQRASVGEAQEIPAAPEPAPDETATEQATADPAAPAATTVTYTLTDESSVTAMGSKTVGTHAAFFNDIEGTITIPDGDPTKGSIQIVVHTPTLDSDDSILTGVLKGEEWFNVEAYPTATFTSTKIEKTDDGKYRITGNLEMRGVTKSLSFVTDSVELTPEQLTADTEFVILRSDWGVGYTDWKGELIKDEVELALSVVAEPAQP